MNQRERTLLAALRAGVTFGYSNKEGMMRVSLTRGDDGEDLYSFYAGGPGYDVREQTADPEAFIAFLRRESPGGPLSGFDCQSGFAEYFCTSGYAALRSGDLEAADEAFARALRWKIRIAAVGAALVLAGRGDAEGARRRLARLDARAAKDRWRYGTFGPVERFFSAATARIQPGDRYVQMQDFWSRILDLAPGRADALYGRGFAREQLEAWAGAASDLEAALEALPEGEVRELAWLRLARVRLQQGRVSEALEVTGRGLAERGGRSFGLRGERIECLTRLERHAEALALIDLQIEATPRSGALFVQRGDVRERLGDLDAAIEDWRRALEHHGGDEEARERLARHGLG